MRELRISTAFYILTCFVASIFYSVDVNSFNICIDPGHGWETTDPLNGWDNCGPVFDVNGEPYQALRQPKSLIGDPTAISNTLEIAQEDLPEWLTIKNNGKPIGLMEYQNNWKIAVYLKQILENRDHTVHLTKSEHANPKFPERAAVAFNNNCDFVISIHTNAPGNGTTALSLFYAKSLFRIDYYRGTPPPTPADKPLDTNPAQWLDENIVCKQNMITPTPGSIPYLVGNSTFLCCSKIPLPSPFHKGRCLFSAGKQSLPFSEEGGLEGILESGNWVTPLKNENIRKFRMKN